MNRKQSKLPLREILLPSSNKVNKNTRISSLNQKVKSLRNANPWKSPKTEKIRVSEISLLDFESNKENVAPVGTSQVKSILSEKLVKNSTKTRRDSIFDKFHNCEFTLAEREHNLTKHLFPSHIDIHSGDLVGHLYNSFLQKAQSLRSHKYIASKSDLSQTAQLYKITSLTKVSVTTYKVMLKHETKQENRDLETHLINMSSKKISLKVDDTICMDPWERFSYTWSLVQ